jgi:hypothetical protein
MGVATWGGELEEVRDTLPDTFFWGDASPWLPNPESEDCEKARDMIRDVETGSGMPHGKSLIRRVIEQVIGSDESYDGHQEEIDNYRGRLKNARRDLNNQKNDCHDKDDWNKRIDRLMELSDPNTVKRRHEEHKQFKEDLHSQIGTAAIGIAIYVAIKAIELWIFPPLVFVP